METTRHFCATTYIVNDGATALHHHDRLDMWLPPGGHIDRDELPRDAARREVREETGLEVTLHEPETDIETSVVSELPGPEHIILEDIHFYDDDSVGHQHIDFIYFGAVPARDIDPDGHDERGNAHWEWYDKADLAADGSLAPEVKTLGREAIETIESR